MKALLDKVGNVEQRNALEAAAGQAFYNTSKFTLRDLRARASRQRLEADFRAWLDGFSPNVQDILESFEFRNQIPRLSKADALGTLIEKLTSPDVNLGPAPVKNDDGSVRHPGLDNHGMGTIFEELVRRFNEENNEEAACIGRGITVMHIYWRGLKYMAIALPPLSEQVAIVRFLDYADARIGRYIHMMVGDGALQAAMSETGQIPLLGEYRTRLIADVVTGKVDVRALKVAG